ncbi:riboflavin synthase domain-like protein [Myriangium duriaei CBS 260.36]|uniref:NADPH--cytochrome P450 reductase n=1 Tax=Myriangium duriaei CBS 260.36 TaxID=1168546 RepID=A0A9P4J5M5_9PEZI|nr:riboflavin synthase domain-like protein [Myriangium duriaei CBS 260.36]
MSSFADLTLPAQARLRAALPYLQAIDYKPSSFLDGLALSLVLLAGAFFGLRGVIWDRKGPYHHLYFERPQLQDGKSGARRKAERNIAEVMDKLDKRIVVFWGSQSGTAEDLANRLSSEIHARFGLNSMSADLSDYDSPSIASIPDTKLAIFIMSTFGEGNPSDNAIEFCEFAEAKKTALPDLRYAAFGLGNSNYKYYNKVIDDVCEWLDDQQAKSIMPVGRANDAEGSTGEDFMTWRDDLFRTLSAYFNVKMKPLVFQTPFAAEEDTCLEIQDLHDGAPVHTLKPQSLPIALSKELFHASDRNCLHMELDIKAVPEMRYKTGDHLAVWPVNPADEVDRLLLALGMTDKRDVPILIRSTDPAVKVKIPTPTSLATLLSHYLEIAALPSRDAVQMLIPFAPSPQAAEFLTTISASRESYHQTIGAHHLTLGRLLLLASSNAPWPLLPLSFLITHLHPLQPRYYSLSSSSVLSPRQPSITAVVERTPIPNAPDQFIPGITTSYLHSLHSISTPEKVATVFAHVRKSKFKLPISHKTPLIMVAAGTGLAPFRAFVAERAKMHAMGREVGKMVLFFGCRKPDEDYIYREELEEAQRQLPEGGLEVVTAFSRARDGEKVYVQDRIAEQGEKVKGLLVEEGASLYICGRAAMARYVASSVAGALEGEEMSREKAEEFLHGLRGRGKWQEDVWG